MILLRSLAAGGLVALGLIAAPGAARAETYATCVGFIDALPATLNKQGVWCLRKDLTTNLASGHAIIIATNNVTVDCNGFKVGGQSAGETTATIGVYSLDRLNSAIRDCAVRGFMYGVQFSGGGGHTVEDNRFDGNTAYGIVLSGDGSVVRRNRVTDTGGSTLGYISATGIWVRNAVDVIDNTVSGVAAWAGGPDVSAYGIFAYDLFDATITGNRVRGLVSTGSGKSYGIFNDNSGRIAMTGNFLFDPQSVGGVGIACTANSLGQIRDNVINGFQTASTSCVDITPKPTPVVYF